MGYACWHNLLALPQLNHDTPAVRAFLFKVAEYWLRKGIDGWRLDAPDCIQTPGF
ncbi:MAG: nplT [Rhodospirillaceae bacterium]|nr:MAG: nplT [Rhodospirillaceae bacterium]